MNKKTIFNLILISMLSVIPNIGAFELEIVNKYGRSVQIFPRVIGYPGGYNICDVPGNSTKTINLLGYWLSDVTVKPYTLGVAISSVKPDVILPRSYRLVIEYNHQEGERYMKEYKGWGEGPFYLINLKLEPK